MKYYKQDKISGEVKEVTPEEILKIVLAGYTKELPYHTAFSYFWEKK